MKGKIYTQQICTDCLQYLVNNESYHSDKEFNTMLETLTKWAKTGYTHLGMTDTEHESYFSHNHCDLCNGLAGNRIDYNFIQAPKNNK